jgi:hypothetical protein
MTTGSHHEGTKNAKEKELTGAQGAPRNPSPHLRLVVNLGLGVLRVFVVILALF